MNICSGKYLCGMKREFLFGLGIIPLVVFAALYFYACSASEKSIAMGEIPTAVLEAFKKANPNVLYADWVVEYDKHQKVYEAKWTLGKKQHEDTFDQNGNHLESK